MRGIQGRTATGDKDCRGVIFAELRALLEAHLPASTRVAASGFRPFKCPLCRDYKPRAGIRFDHSSIGFNCFNCPDTATRFDDGQCFIPKKLERLMLALGISQTDIDPLKLRLYTSRKDESTALDRDVEVDGVTIFRAAPELPLPKGMITLERGIGLGRSSATRAANYLLDERHLPVDPSKVYITTEKTGKWRHRVIFPIVMWGKIVGLTGRTWEPDGEPTYHTLGPKGTTLFNYDAVLAQVKRPVLVTEGIFDALRVGGVATMGNTVSPHQRHWLDAIPRPKIVIPDRGQSGYSLVEAAVENGWGVSFPDFGSCKDVDAAVVRYGIIYVAKEIMSNIHHGESALIRGRTHCSDI